MKLILQCLFLVFWTDSSQGAPSNMAPIIEVTSPNGKMKYECKLCVKNMFKLDDLHRHMEVKHDSYYTSKVCPVCGDGYLNVKMHMNKYENFLQKAKPFMQNPIRKGKRKPRRAAKKKLPPLADNMVVVIEDSSQEEDVGAKIKNSRDENFQLACSEVLSGGDPTKWASDENYNIEEEDNVEEEDKKLEAEFRMMEELYVKIEPKDDEIEDNTNVTSGANAGSYGINLGLSGMNFNSRIEEEDNVEEEDEKLEAEFKMVEELYVKIEPKDDEIEDNTNVTCGANADSYGINLGLSGMNLNSGTSTENSIKNVDKTIQDARDSSRDENKVNNETSNSSKRADESSQGVNVFTSKDVSEFIKKVGECGKGVNISSRTVANTRSTRRTANTRNSSKNESTRDSDTNATASTSIRKINTRSSTNKNPNNSIKKYADYFSEELDDLEEEDDSENKSAENSKMLKLRKRKVVKDKGKGIAVEKYDNSGCSNSKEDTMEGTGGLRLIGASFEREDLSEYGESSSLKERLNCIANSNDLQMRECTYCRQKFRRINSRTDFLWHIVATHQDVLNKLSEGELKVIFGRYAHLLLTTDRWQDVNLYKNWNDITAALTLEDLRIVPYSYLGQDNSSDTSDMEMADYDFMQEENFRKFASKNMRVIPVRRTRSAPRRKFILKGQFTL